MIVQHNLMAVNSHRTLGVNNSQVKKGLEKLSSGYRINRAADDAAGLAVSEKMRAQITGLDRAVKNAQDGSSLVQTAEGAMQEMHSMLNRMVELATQSANGTLASDERQKIESELDALKEEIDRVSSATNFNGIKLLDGSLDKELQPVTYTLPSGDVVGTDALIGQVVVDDTFSVVGGALDSVPDSFRTRGTGPISLAVEPLVGTPTHFVFSIEDRNNPGSFLTEKVNIAVQINNTNDALYELNIDPFGKIEIQNSTTENQSQRLFVSRLATYLSDQMGAQDPYFGVNATTQSKTVMEFVDIDGLILQVGETSDAYQKIAVKIPNMDSEGLGILHITVLNQESAASSITSVREAIDKVSVSRGNMGALQNRLEHTVDNLEQSVENMTAAESRIRDVDMAKEQMTLTKNQILSESSQSMLAQANTQPQQVLQLLQ